MSTKFDGTTAVKPASTKMSGASASSAVATSCPKVSMFASKSGFVIPKNKLTGSLVPRFRVNKKLGGDEPVGEENAKPGQRKTKWGPDLTQDAAVRKGRALAYQTRVDQIGQQLKAGISEFDENLDLPSTATLAEDKSSSQTLDREKSKLLEQEKREAIGEILKLNPSYKAPTDYKPLLKEDKVSIPVKEYPGYNFVGLIFGHGGDNRKRLEKETGAKIQILGIRGGTKDKGEVIQSDGNDFQHSYEEIYVHITAETFDKVDAAVAVIELLITSVSGNLATASAASTNTLSDKDKTSGQLGISSDIARLGQGIQNIAGSLQAPPHGQSQFASPWFVGSPSLPGPQNANQSSSGTIPFSNSAVLGTNSNQLFTNYNPPNGPPPFGPRPIATSSFDSTPQNPPIVSPSMLSSSQILHNAAMTHTSAVGGLVPSPAPPFPQPASVLPISSSATPFPVGQPVQPLASIAGTGGQTFPNVTQGPLPERLFIRPDGIPTLGPMKMMQGAPRMGPPSIVPQPANLPPTPSPTFAPVHSPQNHIRAGVNLPSLHPITSPAGPKQSHPSIGDFTFQPNRPLSSQVFARPGPPQATSFRPPVPDVRPFPQAFPRPVMGAQIPQPVSGPAPISFPPRHPQFQIPGPGAPANAFPPFGERSFNPAAPMPPVGPFPIRPANARNSQFNYHGQMGRAPSQQFGHPGPSFSGRPTPGPAGLQIYDPFSPTSANMLRHQGGNMAGGRKQENDPEYEDLMASVGVK